MPLPTGPEPPAALQPQAGPAPAPEPEAGPRRRWLGVGGDKTAPPVRSLGNSRLEIGPRAEPPESCCGGQGRA